jgi:tRNA(Ser,Leu) C12 N-acetylase TAN1
MFLYKKKLGLSKEEILANINILSIHRRYIESIKEVEVIRLQISKKNKEQAEVKEIIPVQIVVNFELELENKINELRKEMNG